MIVELKKQFLFEAAHHLPHVPAGHKCARVHGHSYRVEVVLRGPVDTHTGWLVAYRRRLVGAAAAFRSSHAERSGRAGESHLREFVRLHLDGAEAAYFPALRRDGVGNCGFLLYLPGRDGVSNPSCVLFVA